MKVAAWGVVLLLLAASAGAKTIRVKTEDIGVIGEESELLDKSKARKMMSAGREAFARIANVLGVTSETIFAQKSPRPYWATWAKRRDMRIWIRLEGTVRVADMGAEAYLERLEDGKLEIVLPIPSEDDLTPGDRYDLWREMTHAIVGHVWWWTCPLWLRDGLAEVMGTVGAKDDEAVLAALTEELIELESPDVMKLIEATDRRGWQQHGGRAASWALVNMLRVAQPKFVLGLLGQNRGLVRHLVDQPGPRPMLQEYTRIVRASIEASGGTDGRLAAVLESYREAGCPDGSALRRTEAYRALRRLRTPKAFGLKIDGGFGMSFSEERSDRVILRYRGFRGAHITWSLPWTSRMDGWVGVRARRSRSIEARPEGATNTDWTCLPWTAERRGKKRFTGERLLLRDPRAAKVGFIQIAVRSPMRLTYVWRKEYPLR